MNSAMVIDTLEKLRPFLDENGVFEVAVRDRNKRFAQIVKLTLGDAQSEQKELAQEALRGLQEAARGIQLDLKSVNAGINALSGLGYANLLLNATNLCATCAGFVIIYDEVKQMGAQVNQRIAQLDETVRKSFDIERKFRFDEVLAEHNDMLDSRRRRQPYSEREMRSLVDSEHRMAVLLANTLEADVSNDQGSLIALLFTLMGMLTASLRIFDELYYHSNPQAQEQPNPWHTSHDNWMGVYDAMSSPWFVERLQDYGVLELGLRTRDADALYADLLDQVAGARQQVVDNQALLVAFKTKEDWDKYQELTKKDVVDSIRNAYRAAGAGMDEREVEVACEEALQKAELA